MPWLSGSELHVDDGAQVSFGNTDDMTISHSGTAAAVVNSTGAFTLDSVGAVAIESSAGSLSIGADAIGQSLFLGTAGARVIQVGSAGAASLSLDGGAGALTAQCDLQCDLDSQGIMSINSSAGAINVGNDAVAQALNLGTGAAARVITVGNAASASLSLEGGVGGATFQCDLAMDLDAGTALSLNSAGGAINVGNDAVAQPVNIATGAAARVITIGDAASASCSIEAGVGSMSLTSDTTCTISQGTVLQLGAGGAAVNVAQAPHLLVGEATDGAYVHQGYTIDVAGGVQTMSAAEMCNGYYYKGAAGGGVALTTAAAADIQTYLAARGITTAAGMCLPDVLIDVSDANALTVTAGAGFTVLGSAAVNNVGAVCKVIFTGAATADIIVVLSS